jgi:NAD(P)-dependent dehydrogenase (short-subunit alcohol dehydrogenase family)
VNPTHDFTGRVAFVTGASSGMGLAAARAFATSGAAVALADVNEAAVHEAAKDLTDAGHRALALACDVTDEEVDQGHRAGPGWLRVRSNEPAAHAVGSSASPPAVPDGQTVRPQL